MPDAPIPDGLGQVASPTQTDAGGPRHQARASRRGIFLAASSGLVLASAAYLTKDSVAPVAQEGPTSKPTATEAPGKAVLSAAAAAPPVAAGQPGSLRLAANLDPLHLLQRATYGATPALLSEVKRVGMATWLEGQLAPTRVGDPGGDAILKSYPDAVISMTDAKAAVTSSSKRRQGINHNLQLAHLGRAIFSQRQVLEVMVDFWSNHFNVNWRGTPIMQWARVNYDVSIRQHALGNFSDLLRVTAEHPAMLTFLNGFENNREEPNENYAREILELHTVGVSGGYTEGDIKQAARLLTGWTTKNAGSYLTRFDPERHYVGPIKVMGFTTANAKATEGVAAMRAFYAYLAKHPATARYICRKLAIRFVADAPSEALVDRLSLVYLKYDTAIVPVLRELFSSPEFASSTGMKLRRPMEFAIASLRAMGAKPNDRNFQKGMTAINAMLRSNQPFGWVTPDGYPDRAQAWSSAGISLEQFNLAASLVNGRIPGFGLPALEQIVPTSAQSSDAVVSFLTQKWFGRAPTSAELSAARTLVTGNSLPTTFTLQYQRPAAAAAIGVMLLHAPSHLVR